MMNDSSENLPDLEERFLPPPNWRWHLFKNPKGRTLRFGAVSPKDRVPDAIVIGLQGLGEFTEKYFEIAHDLLKMNMAFWMIDWQGQGKSERQLKNHHKRHSTGFDEDVIDLHTFILDYVKHAAVHPDVGRIPLVMLGHSMGANVGLRYLYQYPETFVCAAFTSPLFGIRAFRRLPGWLHILLTETLQEIMDHSFVEFGGEEWHESARSSLKHNIYSSDPIRSAVHNTWCLYNPDLQVGNVTYGWLHEANFSCSKLQKKRFIADIKTPCLFALAGREKLVHNAVARKAIRDMPHAELLELPDARHEILMESDESRQVFFDAFSALLKANNVSEQLKPF